MGKEYASELNSMAETYAWARKLPIPELAEFARRSADMPLVAVGSGGSVTAAEFASLMHPGVSRVMTTEEFLERPIPHECAVLLISAGGRNHDILASYAKAARSKPKVLGVVCADAEGLLVKTASSNPDVLVHAATLPTGRDGFLATNTLLATATWILTAWDCRLPRSLRDVACKGLSMKAFGLHLSGKLEKFKDVDCLLVMHDSCGRPAAVDAESKLHEAGLVPVQLADYRNFGHGRHNWMDKHPNTLLLALITSRSSRLAAATMNEVPDHILSCRMHPGIEGPAGALGLLVVIFHVVKFFGTLRGIDPGNPHPPDFGRNLYHMDVSKHMEM